MVSETEAEEALAYRIRERKTVQIHIKRTLDKGG